MKFAPVIIVVSLFIFVLGFGFACAPPPGVDEEVTLTPEQQKALEDSLKEANLRELKIIRSFAYSHYNNKSWAEAAKYYNELAVKDTDHVFNDYAKWAQCLIELSSPADSVKAVYQKGILAFPNDAYLHASLGHIYKIQGLLDSAVVHYETAVPNDPENVDYQLSLAELYTRVGRPLEAIDLYEEILAVQPENKEVAEILVNLKKRNLSMDQYIKSLEEAVALFPDDLEKKFELSRAYIDNGQNDQAIGLLQGIVREQPDNVRALEALGNVNQNLRNYSAALDAYSKILRINPNNVTIMVEMCNCYRLLNDFPQARSYGRRAISADAKNGTGYTALAAVYETAADRRTKDKPPSYYDKLVYLIAYGLYREAKNTGDFRVVKDAETRMSYLKDSQLIPEKADWFMHPKDYNFNKDGGYDWIQPDWAEVKYIETYLNQFSG
mgnify:FL=1